LEDIDMKIIKDLTPNSMCMVGACPAIFETDEQSYLLIGKLTDSSIVPEGRVGQDEVVIEVSKALLANLMTNQD